MGRTWRSLVLPVLVVVSLSQCSREPAPPSPEQQKQVAEDGKVAEAAAELKKIRDEVRALVDPMEELLATDRALIAAGLRPMSGKEFLDRLRAGNRQLLERGLAEYIDP